MTIAKVADFIRVYIYGTLNIISMYIENSKNGKHIMLIILNIIPLRRNPFNQHLQLLIYTSSDRKRPTTDTDYTILLPFGPATKSWAGDFIWCITSALSHYFSSLSQTIATGDGVRWRESKED